MLPPKTLVVKFTNADGARLDMIHAQIVTPIQTRVAIVELTPEQIRLLTPRVTGSNCGSDTFEDWEVVSLMAEATP